MPGSNVIEVQFKGAPADWQQKLEALEDVKSVQSQASDSYRIMSSNVYRKTTTELVEMAVKSKVELKSLSVQNNTTLDDVFVHYTGRQLLR